MKRKKQVLIAFAATLLMAVIMSKHGKPLSDPGKHHIVQLELAKTTQKTQTIFDDWKTEGIDRAIQNTRIDFLFIPAYTAFFFLWSLYLTEKHRHNAIRRLGKAMAAAAILAGCCDVVENFCMLHSLTKGPETFYTNAAFWFAAVKFALLGLLGLLCLYLGIKKWLTRDRKL